MKYVITILLIIFIGSVAVFKSKNTIKKLEKDVELGNQISNAIPEFKDVQKIIEEKLEFDSYEEAMEYSRKNSKPVFLFFEADYCNFCKKMKNDVLSKEEVKQALKKYVTVYVNVAKDDKSLEKYGITQIPTCMFLDKQHHLIQRFTGIKTEKEFMAILEKMN